MRVPCTCYRSGGFACVAEKHEDADFQALRRELESTRERLAECKALPGGGSAEVRAAALEEAVRAVDSSALSQHLRHPREVPMGSENEAVALADDASERVKDGLPRGAKFVLIVVHNGNVGVSMEMQPVDAANVLATTAAVLAEQFGLTDGDKTVEPTP